ncbi:hypothetical protein NHP21005_10160 [Helicobacter sp. NHP21005]|uniref:hypothetical protein n=1 Tax=Helicobacter felistomachi TaxID=3040201 RepID=UPI00257431C3|nr:hypothetical protein [Helicobacter sp. NHP21005]BEG57328.1 hypothetical protein NHP21005_10160 [Helicobacter sp. NHP21005]
MRISGTSIDTTRQAVKDWLKIFHLKDICLDYSPKLPSSVEALLTKKLYLTAGSLLRLLQRKRLDHVPWIKSTLESTDLVLQEQDFYLFVKEIGCQDRVFCSCAKDFETKFIVVGNAYKRVATLKNKIKKGARVVYKNENAVNMFII